MHCLICEVTKVGNYVVLVCEIFGLKMWTCQVYDKYYSCSLYSTVKVLILSHISVWRLGLKISRSCPVLKYLVSIVNMIVKEQLKIERNCFIKMISTKMISTTMISIKLSSGRRNLEFPAAARGAGSQDDPAGKAA